MVRVRVSDMITKEQALELKHNEYIHYNGCTRRVGPQGGVTIKIERYRVASNTKTWVTRPDDFSFTVKYGMRPRTYTVDNINSNMFHIESECPLNE
jgi:hypothetical protein